MSEPTDEEIADLVAKIVRVLEQGRYPLEVGVVIDFVLSLYEFPEDRVPDRARIAFAAGERWALR